MFAFAAAQPRGAAFCAALSAVPSVMEWNRDVNDPVYCPCSRPQARRGVVHVSVREGVGARRCEGGSDVNLAGFGGAMPTLRGDILRERCRASRTYVGLLRGRGADRVAAARLLKDFAVLKGARDDSHDST